MSHWLTYLELAAAVTLLLWAARMVRTGMVRANGAALRRLLRTAEGERIRAAGIGLITAVLLQSSTAAAMLTTGFASSGLLGLAPSLAILLGADLGSALVVQILSIDLVWLPSVLIVVGGWLFMTSGARVPKQIGRVLLGIALILISLKMIGAATGPLRDSNVMPIIIGYLANDYASAFLLGALFTWLIHSSVASVLLFISLVAQQVIPLEVGVVLTLGANLGAGLIAVGLTHNASIEARRIPIGNLVFRTIGSIAAVIAFAVTAPSFNFLGVSAAGQIGMVHLAFNAALVMLGLPFCGAVASALNRLLPDTLDPADEVDPRLNRVSSLDRSVLDVPRLALASATREILQMGETIEVMFRPIMDLYQSGDKASIKRIQRLDEHVNRAHSEIKLYLAELGRRPLTEEETRRSAQLMHYSINLEFVGDIIAKTLLGLALEVRREGLTFSKEGWRDLTEQHDRVLTNMRLSLNVLVSNDIESARELIEEKVEMREFERASHDRHLLRLQRRNVESMETSEIHLETVRALKQINSAFASISYSILSESGELLESRLAANG